MLEANVTSPEEKEKDQSEGGPLLFRPISFRGVTLRNRIVSSPMCQYASCNGSPTDWHFAHMGRLAIGGAGLVFYEETAVEARGRKTYDCAGLWKDAQISSFRRVVELIHGIGAKVGIQLGHAGGRGSSLGAMNNWIPLEKGSAGSRRPWRVVSASAVPVEPGRPVCKALKLDEIKEIVAAWAAAARRSHEAGFDVLEIHGAHGYLIQQFLSPITNIRGDAYGGDRNGRMRFALEVAEAVRSEWPSDKPLFFRVSCVDGEGGDWDLYDTLALAHELKKRGVDAIDCSSGGISGNSPMPIVPRIPGYHVPYARRVRQQVGIPTLAVGRITDAYQAEGILRKGEADLIAMAHELMLHGDWPAFAARELRVACHFDLFPPPYAFRLKRRDKLSAMLVNRHDAQIPISKNGLESESA